MPQDQRCEPVRERPQEDDDGAGQVGRRAERQGDGEKPPETAGALDFGGLLEAGVDGGEARRKAEDDERQHVEGLDEHQPVHAVDKVDGRLDQPGIHEEQVQGAVLAEENDEGEHSGIGRQHDRQQDQSGEDGLAPLAVARQNVRQGHAEQGGGSKHQRAQDQGVAKGLEVIGVPEKLQVIADAEAAGFERF